MLRQLSPRLDVHTRLLSAPGQPSPQNIYTVDEDEDLEILSSGWCYYASLCYKEPVQGTLTPYHLGPTKYQDS